MLFYFSFFYLLTFIVLSLCQNTFVTTKMNRITCVTNSSSGISWNFKFTGVTSMNESLHNTYNALSGRSQFIPKQRSNNFDCEITDDYQTKKYYQTKPWILKKSWESTTDKEIILDRRWEEMQVYSTPSSREEHILVSRNLGPNFDIPISIRIARAAYIYLCEGPDPKKSSCYFFGLKGFEKNMNGIRKCPSQDMPQEAYKYPSSPCTDMFSKKILSDNPLDENLWKHFKLTKRGNYTSLKNEQNDILLQLRDNMSDFTHMFLYSGNVAGLWKIHDIDYIYTKKATNDIILGPSIRIYDSFVCISMIVSMCESCQLNLKLRSDNLLIGKEGTYRPQSSKKKWFEIKFTVENNAEDPRIDKADLLVSTIGTNKSNEFWKIDKVRLCQKTEFRIIESNHEAACQSIEEHTLINSTNSVAIIASTCPANTVGTTSTFCVPCQWIPQYYNCDKAKVCTPDELRRTACWCSAGFTNLPYCENGCTEGRYGFSCNKTCGHCLSRHATCDARNGTCLSSCVKNYVGPQCDRIRVSAPYDLKTEWISNNELLLKWRQIYGSESKLTHFSVLVSKCQNVCNTSDNVFWSKFFVGKLANNFTYTVNASFEPSTYYTVTIFSNNTYSTNRAYKTDVSPPEVPYLYQKAKFIPTGSTITIELELSAKNLTVLISDNSGYVYAHPELEIFGTKFTNFSKYRTVVAFKSCYKKCAFVIGSGSLGTQNPPLIPNTSYNITYILSTTYKNKTSHRVYFTTCSTSSTKLELLSLLVLLLIPLVVTCLMWKKLKSKRICNLRPRQLTLVRYENDSIQEENLLVSLSSNPDFKRNNRKTKNVNSYLNPVFPSRIISVKDFPNYVKQAEKDGEIDRQFEVINSSRKIYDEVEGNRFFHYIDMTFVNGSVVPKAFIVTEVPKLSQTHEFWRNISEGNVKHIVVLNCRENSKCFQYWPQINEKLEYGNLSIQLFSQQNSLHYELRRFILNHNETKKYVDHIHFCYNGTDVKNYVPLFKKLSEYSLSSSSPILIHTSDLINRIGFVLLCDMSIRMATEEGVVDVLGNFKRLSDQVAPLVDDLHLHKLSYSVISEYIFGAELACNLIRVYNNLKKSSFN